MRTAGRTLLILTLLAPGFAATESKPESKFELRGKVHYSAARFRMLHVSIFGIESSFTTSTFTDPAGEFHFSGLNPGTYTLSVIRRGLGEIRRSVVVTPGLADKKGIVRTDIQFSPADAVQGRSVSTVSRNQLTVPPKAMSKYVDAAQKLKKNDIEAARKLLMEAVTIAPQYASAWNYLGVLSYKETDFDKAEEYFRHAISLDKESFEPTVNLGGVMLARRNLKESLQYNQRAVELRAKDALANAQLGMTYFYMGQMDTAFGYLEIAKTVDPAHFTMPQSFLSRIYERRGDRVAAAQEIVELLALRPDIPEADQWKRRLQRLQAVQAR